MTCTELVVPQIVSDSRKPFGLRESVVVRTAAR